MLTTNLARTEIASTVLSDDRAIKASAKEDAAASNDALVEREISSLPLIRYLRSQSSGCELTSEPTSFKEFHLHSNLNPPDFDAHLVSGSLYGQSKLPIAPRLFIQASPVCRVFGVWFIGPQLCGHPGYVHGGVHFALFDDVFARCAATVIPSGVGMTANLNIDFRKPSVPNRLYIMCARVVRHEGRKVWVQGSIRCLPPVDADRLRQLEAATTADSLSTEEADGELVAEASALFVEPRFANSVAPIFRHY